MFPDYQKSIVNLMSSVLRSFSVSNNYPELDLIPSKELLPQKNIILLVIDGLGYEFLRNEFKDEFLLSGLRGDITSVFPSTTASAITSYLTGVAPLQHGISGWNMLLKELGVVSTIMLFQSRMGGALSNDLELAKRIFSYPSIFKQIKSQSYYILPKSIAGSLYTLAHQGDSKKIAIQSINDLTNAIHRSVLENQRKKLIYAYWSHYDHLAHTTNYNSPSSFQHLNQLVQSLKNLANQLKNTSSTLIISSDHGFTNIGESDTIELKHHPFLQNCLSLPLCGESRMPYCYVKLNKGHDFEGYLREHFSDRIEVVKSEELMDKGVFGYGEKSIHFEHRIGDYILLMKGNTILKDFLVNEKEHFCNGRHGGCSDLEMKIPLIVFHF